MATIRWTTRAASDLAAVHDFIARDSPRYAVHTVEKILAAAARLAPFPESGRRLPEYPERPQRESLVGRYRLIYRYDPSSDTVLLLGVAHTRQDRSAWAEGQ